MHQALSKALESAATIERPHANRETWLAAFVAIVRPAFYEMDKPLPERVRISCGFPKGSRAAIGQCFSAESSKDGAREVFVSPVIDDPLRVCDVVLHELAHAALPEDEKHGKQFKKLATALGLEGKMTATVASEELSKALAVFVPNAMGTYPHGAMSPTKKTKQSCRMLKLECDGCGMVIRTTRKWIDERGAPTCACGSSFVEEEGEEGGED